MTKTADVVIAGGGVMGSAAAYFLTADPDFDGSVTVVERDPTYATASTTLSWGGVRQQFSLAENIRMSMFGIGFVKEAAESLKRDIRQAIAKPKEEPAETDDSPDARAARKMILLK